MNKPSTSKKNEDEDQNIEDGELVETNIYIYIHIIDTHKKTKFLTY